MSAGFHRPQDVLREMRGTVVSVEDDDVAEARRRRVVATMRTAQRAGLARQSQRSVWRRRLATIGFLLVPSAALAAAWLVATPREIPKTEARTETSTPNPSAGKAPRATNTPAAPPTIATAETTPAAETTRATDERPVRARPSLQRAAHPASTKLETQAPEVAQATANFPSASTLAIENALMQSAMAASRSGDDARAVVLFDDLLSRYPMSPLSPSARAERLRSIARRDGSGGERGGTTP